MKHQLLMACIGALLAAAPIRAADLGTETFPSGPGSWQASLALGAGAWSFTGGHAEVLFVDTSPTPIPDVGILETTAPHLTGDLLAAGAEFLALRFLALDGAPSSVNLELHGAGAVYQQLLTVKTVGDWVDLNVPIGETPGGWVRIGGTNAPWASAVRNVTSIVIKVYRSGATTRRFAVDDIVLGQRPTLAMPRRAADGSVQVSMEPVAVGYHYAVETAGTLTGTWERSGTWAATGAVATAVMTNPPPGSTGFWRLVMP